MKKFVRELKVDRERERVFMCAFGIGGRNWSKINMEKEYLRVSLLLTKKKKY